MLLLDNYGRIGLRILTKWETEHRLIWCSSHHRSRPVAYRRNHRTIPECSTAVQAALQNSQTGRYSTYRQHQRNRSAWYLYKNLKAIIKISVEKFVLECGFGWLKNVRGLGHHVCTWSVQLRSSCWKHHLNITCRTYSKLILSWQHSIVTEPYWDLCYY